MYHCVGCCSLEGLIGLFFNLLAHRGKSIILMGVFLYSLCLHSPLSQFGESFYHRAVINCTALCKVYTMLVYVKCRHCLYFLVSAVVFQTIDLQCVLDKRVNMLMGL